MTVGGGSRSTQWLEIIATLLDVSIDVPVDGDFGASLGAARLGQAAAEGRTSGVFSPPPMRMQIEPRHDIQNDYRHAYERWRTLYPALKQAGF